VAAPRNGLEGRAGTVAGYGLYVDVVRVVSFTERRIGYREWARRNGRLGDIHSLVDRYDHDVEELMG
jgi:hypothetical protein